MPRNTKHLYYSPSPKYRCLQIEQGIYAARSEVINGDPKIREGVCGTPIVVQGKSKWDDSLLSNLRVYDVKGYANDGQPY
jgi:hypothetical protein